MLNGNKKFHLETISHADMARCHVDQNLWYKVWTEATQTLWSGKETQISHFSTGNNWNVIIYIARNMSWKLKQAWQ
jgi:hypothetical protein